MGRLSWHKRDHHAALEGMRKLTPEEKGVYTTILDLIYETAGRLEDDAKFICYWLDVDPRVWKRVRDQLIAKGKLFVEDGIIHNRRADTEVAIALAKVVAKADVGRQGGLKTQENNRLAQAPAQQILEDLEESKTQDKQDSESNDSLRARDSDQRVGNGAANGHAEPERSSTPEPELPLEPRQRRKRDRSVEPPGFDAFWLEYPKKVARPLAAQAFVNALKRATPEAIMAGLRRALPDWDPTEARGRFIPHPASWLNQDRWTDGEGPTVAAGMNRVWNEQTGKVEIMTDAELAAFQAAYAARHRGDADAVLH